MRKEVFRRLARRFPDIKENQLADILDEAAAIEEEVYSEKDGEDLGLEDEDEDIMGEMGGDSSEYDDDMAYEEKKPKMKIKLKFGGRPS